MTSIITKKLTDELLTPQEDFFTMIRCDVTVIANQTSFLEEQRDIEDEENVVDIISSTSFYT